ncbi:hypothetical protein J132_01413 [Termitomyces sp. J132]|nr:hypothetical protein H2248_007396 [Termitomyces sp. 'cryptogamus']KNZ73028.1 hypothetical protein J132_01413 [Termitomyces sp. J132]
MDSHNLLHSTSSTPIEIPRRRTSSSWTDGRPMSPDLIFEMSPVSSDFSSVLHSGFTDAVTNEPFLYSFPKISPHCTHVKPRRLLQPLQRHLSSEIGSLLAFDSVNTEYDRPSPALCSDNDDQDILASSLTYSTTTITKSPSSSTTKITGFTPATPISLVAHGPARGKSQRLSPPPRTSSYSSSPWIMPGKNDVQQGESGSLDIDPGSFEFDRHLTRRIENQNSRKFRKISLMSSIRV